MTSTPPRSNDALVWSYLGLRRAIGTIGFGMPFALLVGKWLLQGAGIEPSISDYYYTKMGDVFVGCLCAIGVFLLTYRGYDRRDDLAGTFACVFALGVALFPTARDGAVGTARLIGTAHYVSAALMFLILAYFCLVLFRSTDPTRPMTPEKRARNRIYAVCGVVILACIAGIAAVKVVGPMAALARFDPVFWLESIAVLAFGASWLVKGEVILEDG